MDGNVVAALISLIGGAAFGAASRALRQRKELHSDSNIFKTFRDHPVMHLEKEIDLSITCHDAVRCSLLNSIRVSVFCRPVSLELTNFVTMMKRTEAPRTQRGLQESISALRTRLLRRQCRAMLEFPKPTHFIIRKTIDLQWRSLSLLSDMIRSKESSPQQIAATVVQTYYVSTFAVLTLWTQTAAKHNGSFNGVCWDGKMLEHSFGGNITDIKRILTPAVASMHDALGCFDTCVFLLDATGRIQLTCGEESFGYGAHSLLGQAFTVLQLDVNDLTGSEDLQAIQWRSARAGDNQVMRERTCIKASDGTLWSCVITLTPLKVTLPTPAHFSLVVLLKIEQKCEARGPDESPGEEREDLQWNRSYSPAVFAPLDDCHTRSVFLLSALHSTRRVIVSCAHTQGEAPAVLSVLDGSLGLPSFITERLLHEQMETTALRVHDAITGCALKAHHNQTHFMTIAYDWRGIQVMAELFLVGLSKKEEQESHPALLSIHRLHVYEPDLCTECADSPSPREAPDPSESSGTKTRGRKWFLCLGKEPAS